MSYSFLARLAGSNHVERNYRKFCTGRDHSVRLEFEPDNPVDPNAVKVLGGSSGLFIGYLDRDSAKKIARMKSKQLTAEAILENGECYMLTVTLEVTPRNRKKSPETGIILADNTVIGCVVKAAIPEEELKNISGELTAFPEGENFSIRQTESGNLIGMLDAQTAAILIRSEAGVSKCETFNFYEDHLFLKITATAHLLSDLEYQQKQIAALFQRLPQYYGAHFGDDPPTENQFNYAFDLGVDMRDQTFQSTSNAIDRAKKNPNYLNDFSCDEKAELYRYLSRTSNRRYAFLDEIENAPWKSKKRPRPNPKKHGLSLGCWIPALIIAILIILIVFSTR